MRAAAEYAQAASAAPRPPMGSAVAQLVQQGRITVRHTLNDISYYITKQEE